MAVLKRLVSTDFKIFDRKMLCLPSFVLVVAEYVLTNECCCDLQFSMENYRGLIQDMSPQDREVSRPKRFSLLL